ncbi:MAG TPA: hypothetical protein VGE74_03505 [Gemmata sp.]
MLALTPTQTGCHYALVCPLHTIRRPTNPAERDHPRLFSLCAQLDGAPATTCEFRLQIREEHGLAVYTGPKVLVSFAATAGCAVLIWQWLNNLFAFSEHESYFVYVLCDGQSLREPGLPNAVLFPPAQLTVLG